MSTDFEVTETDYSRVYQFDLGGWSIVRHFALKGTDGFEQAAVVFRYYAGALADLRPFMSHLMPGYPIIDRVGPDDFRVRVAYVVDEADFVLKKIRRTIHHRPVLAVRALCDR